LATAGRFSLTSTEKGGRSGRKEKETTYKGLARKYYRHIRRKAQKRFFLELGRGDLRRMANAIEKSLGFNRPSCYEVELVGHAVEERDDEFPRSYWHVMHASRRLSVVYEHHSEGGLVVTVLESFDDVCRMIDSEGVLKIGRRRRSSGRRAGNRSRQKVLKIVRRH